MSLILLPEYEKAGYASLQEQDWAKAPRYLAPCGKSGREAIGPKEAGSDIWGLNPNCKAQNSYAKGAQVKAKQRKKNRYFCL